MQLLPQSTRNCLGLQINTPDGCETLESANNSGKDWHGIYIALKQLGLPVTYCSRALIKSRTNEHYLLPAYLVLCGMSIPIV